MRRGKWDDDASWVPRLLWWLLLLWFASGVALSASGQEMPPSANSNNDWTTLKGLLTDGASRANEQKQRLIEAEAQLRISEGQIVLLETSLQEQSEALTTSRTFSEQLSQLLSDSRQLIEQLERRLRVQRRRDLATGGGIGAALGALLMEVIK